MLYNVDYLVDLLTTADHRVTPVAVATDDDVDDSVPFIPISQFNKMIPQVVCDHMMMM